MPDMLLSEILELLLVDPLAPSAEGGKTLQDAFCLNPGRPVRWKAWPVNIALAADHAYKNYYYKGGGCGYGVFSGLVAACAIVYGPPYSEFPLEALVHKKSGFSGQGKVCGALVGAQAILPVFFGKAKARAAARELFLWYEGAALPQYAPPEELIAGAGGSGAEHPLPVSAAGSCMCVDSLKSWAASCSFKIEEKTRKERCARLTADVAEKTAQLINAGIN